MPARRTAERRPAVLVSSTTMLPSYMQWDREVLEHVGELADYISLHRYVDNRAGDTADFLAVTNSIHKEIEDMDAVCRFVQARRRGYERAYLCFDEYSKRRNGRSLRVVVDGPGYVGTKNGRVTWVDTSAIVDGDQPHVFATNRSLEEPASVRIVLADRAIAQVLECEIVTGDDPKAGNDFDAPDRIVAQPFEGAQTTRGMAEFELPLLSVAAMNFALAGR